MRRPGLRRLRVYVPSLGEPGLRDPQSPCGSFTPGSPGDGQCETDGHYLCKECGHMSAEALLRAHGWDHSECGCCWIPPGEEDDGNCQWDEDEALAEMRGRLAYLAEQARGT